MDEINIKKGINTKSELVRIGGRLKEIVTIRDQAGSILEKVVKELRVEFYFRDVLQAIVGALLLATPVAFTEEVWNLGNTLPGTKVIFLAVLSLTFLGLFVYHNFYHSKFLQFPLQFFVRVLTIYLISILVVALILTTIDKAPWSTDLALALKRVVIVSLPASMSAAIADMIK